MDSYELPAREYCQSSHHWGSSYQEAEVAGESLDDPCPLLDGRMLHGPLSHVLCQSLQLPPLLPRRRRSRAHSLAVLFEHDVLHLPVTLLVTGAGVLGGNDGVGLDRREG